MCPTATAGREPGRVPTLWETQDPAATDRLVRALLASGPATEPRRRLRRLRADHPAHRRRTVPPCWERSPHRILVRAANLAQALDDPPAWLAEFAAYLIGRHHPSRACAMLTRLGKHLVDDHPVHPQALLDTVAADVPLRRALEDFLTANKLALPPDRDERRAATRRRSRIDAVPEPLRDAVAGFAEHLLASRDRARRAGTHPRGHATLEARLTAVRDFAQFLTARRSKLDWATVEVGDVEAFLHAHPSRRASYLAGLRQFCRYALGVG